MYLSNTGLSSIASALTDKKVFSFSDKCHDNIMFTLMENQCWSKFGVGQIRKWKMDKDNFLAFIGT